MPTRPKKLHTGASIWTAYTRPRIAHAPLKKDISVDITIIGAGITGAMAAEELADAGFSVVLIDKRPPLSGSTLATTALLQYEIDCPLSLLQKKTGLDDAAAAWRRSKLSLDSLVARIRILGIDCGLEERDTLYLAGNLLDSAGLRREQALRNEIALQTQYLTRRKLRDDYGLRVQAGLRSFGSYTVHPVRMAAGFLKAAQEKGAEIYAPAEALHIDCGPRHAHVHTKHGPVIKARHVIYATGYEVPEEIDKSGFRIASTWAMATKPQKMREPARQPLIWQAADPYLYMRTTPDGRMICGGEDESFSDAPARDALIPSKIQALQRHLQKLYPGLSVTADYAWAGCFGETPTGLPLIGEIPHKPNCFAILAFGGNGITFSRIAAEILRNALTGRCDLDASLFEFPA